MLLLLHVIFRVYSFENLFCQHLQCASIFKCTCVYEIKMAKFLRDFKICQACKFNEVSINYLPESSEDGCVAKVNSVSASKDVNKYLHSFFLLLTVAVFDLPGVWSNRRRSAKESCLLPVFFMGVVCTESPLTLTIKDFKCFPCLVLAISGGGVLCYAWGANKGCKSCFRTLTHKIFTPQTYHSSIKLLMKWKICCDDKT